ncbi:hypothetical protein KBTX_00478 [wastewater metagenome]|uniref:AAA+ ATPase domain-containing protein n=2 Tax=unclassified sequences TaxID=12908 RepID=A0A5B8RBM5_9ZZZZ|nr:ExeA family protein [Arhodomonas sp. KWT]QEA04175.1 hypothetical protein KBTEX_00478 [uncultured organism]
MAQAFTAHAYLGLSRHPFPPTPDPAAYYYTHGMEQELAELAHCIDTRKGIMLVTGEVGLGKSTLLRRLLDAHSGGDMAFALVFNTFLQGPELLAAICADFGLEPADSVSVNLQRLNDFLIAERRAGRNCVLLVDDAQNLSITSLELVRLLSNLETGQDKLLQIILCGQPELEQTLEADSLRQLRSRIVKRLRLAPLTAAEIPRYVEFRVNAAGDGGRLGLGPGAARALFQATGGNLRSLHLILDRCLYGLVGRQGTAIDAGLVREAARELGYRPARRRPLRFAAAAAATFAVAAALTSLGVHQSIDEPGAAGDWISPVLAAVHTPFDDSGPPPGGPGDGKIRLLPVPSPQPAHAAGGGIDDLATAVRERRPATRSTAGATCMDTLRARHGPDGVSLRPLPRRLGRAIAGDASRQLCTLSVHDRRWIAMPVMPPLREGALVRHVQKRLVDRGLLEPDGVDGLMGPVTQDALQRFQRTTGIPGTGEIDSLTILALRVLGGDRRQRLTRSD